MLTLAEAAEQTGYTQRRLRQFAEKKLMTADLFGKTYVVRQSELDRFMSEHRPDRGRPRGSKNRKPPTP